MAWADDTSSYGGKVGKIKYTLTVADGDTTETTTPIAAGAWKHLMVTVPTLTGATAAITIDDEDGKEIYTSGALAESTDHSIPMSRFLTGKETLEVTLNSAQSGSTAAVIVKVWFVGDI